MNKPRNFPSRFPTTAKRSFVCNEYLISQSFVGLESDKARDVAPFGAIFNLVNKYQPRRLQMKAAQIPICYLASALGS